MEIILAVVAGKNYQRAAKSMPKCFVILAGTRRLINSHDILSEHCQRRRGVRVERLDRFDAKDAEWKEAIVNDPRTSVFHQVWFRIDFPAWLALLSSRTRKMALAMARGESTAELAQRFLISPARVSQIRRELFDSWNAFHDGKYNMDGELTVE